MGFRPKHCFLIEVLAEVRNNMTAPDLSQVNCITGPVMFTKVWKSFQHKHPNIQMYLFPKEFCYPYSYWDHVYKRSFQFQPDTHAVHMWGASWHQPEGYLCRGLNDFSRLLQNVLVTRDGLVYSPKG